MIFVVQKRIHWWLEVWGRRGGGGGEVSTSGCPVPRPLFFSWSTSFGTCGTAVCPGYFTETSSEVIQYCEGMGKKPCKNSAIPVVDLGEGLMDLCPLPPPPTPPTPVLSTSGFCECAKHMAMIHSPLYKRHLQGVIVVELQQNSKMLQH